MPVEVEKKLVIYTSIAQFERQVKLLPLFAWGLNRRTIYPLSESLIRILLHWREASRFNLGMCETPFKANAHDCVIFPKDISPQAKYIV